MRKAKVRVTLFDEKGHELREFEEYFVSLLAARKCYEECIRAAENYGDSTREEEQE